MEMKEEMKPYIINYLESCAYGVWDGALKADSHARLCEIYCKYNIEADEDLIRSATRKLTDHLDEEIDFPLKKAPQYAILWHNFYRKFVTYAGEV